MPKLRVRLLPKHLRRAVPFGVLQVFFREFLVVEIVQVTHAFPMVNIFAKMLRHSTHGVTDIERVDDERFFGDVVWTMQELNKRVA